MLQDCVSLSLDMDPIENRSSGRNAKVQSLISIAEGWFLARTHLILGDQDKYPAYWKVNLRVFGALAKEKGWELPHEFPIGELPKESRTFSAKRIETLNTSDHPNYSEELEIAIYTWTMLCADKQKKPNGGWKDYIEKWIQEEYPHLSNHARSRISTMVNPQKRGGATPTSE